MPNNNYNQLLEPAVQSGFINRQDVVVISHQHSLSNAKKQLSSMFATRLDLPYEKEFTDQVQTFLFPFTPKDRNEILSAAVFDEPSCLYNYWEQILRNGRTDLIDQLIDLDAIKGQEIRVCQDLIGAHGEHAADYTQPIKRLLDNGLRADTPALHCDNRTLFIMAFDATAMAETKEIFILKMKLLSLFAQEKYHPNWNFQDNGNNLLMRIPCLCFIQNSAGDLPYIKNAFPLLKFVLKYGGVDPNELNHEHQNALQVFQKYSPFTRQGKEDFNNFYLNLIQRLFYEWVQQHHYHNATNSAKLTENPNKQHEIRQLIRPYIQWCNTNFPFVLSGACLCKYIGSA